MKLFELHNQLKSLFNLEAPEMECPEGITCYTQKFQSDFYFNTITDAELDFEDQELKNHFESEAIAKNNKYSEINLNHLFSNETGEETNRTYRYAIFTPGGKNKYNNCIVLLHGLNERSWDKYLTWAHFLVRKTGKPVLLFPLAFHMNRSPKSWSCPRLMSQVVALRKKKIPTVKMTTFANAAMSLRMDTDPQMFATSGIQSYFDLIKLVGAIKSGQNPMFNVGCCIGIFAYSIGALLAEIVLLSNPLNLFSNEKAFLFCGGATFDKINGVSRSIMDSHAFESLKSFISCNPEINSQLTLPHYQIPLLQNAWQYFQSMINQNMHTTLRESGFENLSGQIMALGLTNDLVVPGKAIAETLMHHGNTSTVEILDFPYNYSHEKPFPMENPNIAITIEPYFRKVFTKAADFLS